MSPDCLNRSWLTAVDAQLLAGDDYSSSMLVDYNSVDIHLNVTINNKAWYPDLGYVARVNHNRLANKMQSEGFNVVRASQPAFCIIS